MDWQARDALFALSQESEEGYQAASEVVMTYIKKLCDDDKIYNPSGFVHKATKNARNEIKKNWWW